MACNDSLPAGFVFQRRVHLSRHRIGFTTVLLLGPSPGRGPDPPAFRYYRALVTHPDGLFNYDPAYPVPRWKDLSEFGQVDL